ncbi:transcriptional regulator [Hyphococcus sp.]|uniref:transcriptional regulator n=2 Tax=Hyphococcus sp. TaxID=2038636 RepID=UPI0035C76D4B
MNNGVALTMETKQRGNVFQCDVRSSGPQSEQLRALGKLDPILFSRSRLLILAYLGAVSEATFTELRTGIGATDGNVFVHLNKLCERRYVLKRQGRRPGKETIICITPDGRKALHRFRMALTQIDGSTESESKKDE